MPTYDRVVLTEQARRLGFPAAPFEKTTRLTEILRFLNETDELRELLALKGGTAINLTMFNLPRLSIDIDLDFTVNLTREETRTKRDRIGKLLERHMTAEGYAKHGKSKRTHILDSFVYAYTNAAGNSDNIKAEINYSLRSHVLPVGSAAVKTGEVFTAFSVRRLAPVEIFASKIVALTGRGAARDLYDLNNMIYFGLFDEPDLTLLRKCAVFYLAVAGDTETHSFSLERVEDITPHKIKTDLRPMIRNAERFDLQAARERVLAFLNGHMTLSENESVFLRRFASGHYEPELLFEDEEILGRIENHPMAVWRIRHIRDGRQER
jgi:predicted nucleotidyltransferase component of viral defense system